MRENRTCSSEGGEPGDRASLPYHSPMKFQVRVSEPWAKGRNPVGIDLCLKSLKM